MPKSAYGFEINLTNFKIWFDKLCRDGVYPNDYEGRYRSKLFLHVLKFNQEKHYFMDPDYHGRNPEKTFFIP